MPQFTEMRRPELWDGAHSQAVPHWGSRPPRVVVLGYDGSAAARCAALRAAEAAGSGGRILAITAIPSPEASEFERELADIVDPQTLLREAEALLRGHEVENATRVEAGDPVEVLIAAALRVEADLVVVGARGRNYLARVLRGSVAERLVARAPCDVLVARSGNGAGTP